MDRSTYATPTAPMLSVSVMGMARIVAGRQVGAGHAGAHAKALVPHADRARASQGTATGTAGGPRRGQLPPQRPATGVRGVEKDCGARIYIQDIESGLIRAISPERVATEGLATHDSRYVVGKTREQVFAFAVDGGAPIPLSYLDRDDEPLQWSTDDSVLYVRRAGAWPPVVDRVDTRTGKREPWKTIQPGDPTGVDTVVRIVVTPDGRSYCHDYVRLLSELFVVEGLKRARSQSAASCSIWTRASCFGRGMVSLSPKAYQLLELLVLNKPKALSKSVLQDRIGPTRSCWRRTW